MDKDAGQINSYNDLYTDHYDPEIDKSNADHLNDSQVALKALQPSKYAPN